MALSQKHPGLMIVPWFNRQEWNHVYRLLQDNTDSSNLKEAQEILQTWKIRTPNLPTGVEGTLMLLNIFQMNEVINSKYIIQVAYGMTLVRFLNMCCASGDKQGTFSESVKANNIPEWIVNTRHDLSHKHNLPKVTKLKEALNFCFKWVLENYWKKQDESLVSQYSVVCLTVKSIGTAMELFCEINALNYQEKGTLTLKTMELSNPSLKQKLSKLTQSAKIKMGSTIPTVLRILLQYVTDNYADIPHEQLKDFVGQTVLSSEGFFSVHEPHNLENDKVQELPGNYVQAWTGLIDALFETQLLVYFLKMLLDIVSCGMYESVRRKVASLWIYNVSQRLLLTLLDKNNARHNKLLRRYPSLSELQPFPFCNKNNRVYEEIKELRVAVIGNPTKYKLLFLHCFLHVCQYPNDYITEAVAIMQLYCNPKMKDIDLSYVLQTVPEDQEPVSLEKVARQDLPDVTMVDDHSPKSYRFEPVTDYSIFKDCPLGILSSQERDKNPWVNHEFIL